MENQILIASPGGMQKAGVIEIRHGELVLPDDQWVIRDLNIDEVVKRGVKSPDDDCHACL
jgi:hypothetical protein